MRAQKEIEKKLEDLYENRLKLRLRRFLKVSHRNCIYNERVLVEASNHLKIGCCTCEKLKNGDALTVCDSDEKSDSCKYYEGRWNREKIEKDFLEDIKNPKICGQREPKIAILLWVLYQQKKFPDEQQMKSFWSNLWGKIKSLKKNLSGSV